MNDGSINYEAVLADLRAKREAIDSAIVGIEKVLGISATGIVASIAGTPAVSLEGIPSDAFFGLSIPDAIKKCLGMLKRKQPVKVLCDALGRGGVNSTSKNFYSTVYSTLARMEKVGDVVKIDTEWGLPEWYPGMRKDRKIKKSAVESQNEADERADVQEIIEADMSEQGKVGK
jgi:hypothetical protein